MSREDDIRAIFDSYDKDGDGYLEGPEELKAAFGDVNQEVTEEELETIVAFADENGDGRLNFEEFSNFVL